MSRVSLVAAASGIALAASGSFLLGQYKNYLENCNEVVKLIKTDPYAFHLKDKLFQILKYIPEETPNRMEEVLKYGIPGLDEIRVFSNFVLSYDRRNRVAHWVMEHITANCLGNRHGVNRRFSQFRSDHAIPSLFRSHNYDYFHSGFDRGHLAAAANHKCQQIHCDETFYLVNIAPQVGPGFNRDAWNNLEIYVRNLTNTFPNVYICTGSLYLPGSDSKVSYGVIGRSVVAVPTHFFKVVLCVSKGEKFFMEAYVLPNAFIDNSIDLKSFRRPPEEIEQAAGLLFFDKIRRNQFISINGTPVAQEEQVD